MERTFGETGSRLTFMGDAARIKEAARKFPDEFGLRAFPGKRFKIHEGASYVSEREGVLLYAFIKEGDTWSAFCKGTPAELQRQITT